MRTKILLALLALTMTGCAGFQEAYKKQPWTPDSVNYTLQRDRKTGDMSDYWGASWSLK